MRLLTKVEVAELARVKPRTVDLWTQEGRLRVIKAGRLNRFLLVDLEKFLGLKAGSLCPPEIERR